MVFTLTPVVNEIIVFFIFYFGFHHIFLTDS